MPLELVSSNVNHGVFLKHGVVAAREGLEQGVHVVCFYVLEMRKLKLKCAVPPAGLLLPH